MGQDPKCYSGHGLGVGVGDLVGCMTFPLQMPDPHTASQMTIKTSILWHTGVSSVREIQESGPKMLCAIRGVKNTQCSF